MPVDPSPPLPVAAPLPHFRKIAFAFGALATVAVIFLARFVIAL